MVRPSSGLFAALFLLLATSSVSAALSPEQLKAFNGLMPTRQSGLTYEDYLVKITKPIRLYDLKHDGLDQSDVDLMIRIEDAQWRLRFAGEFLVMDLDNDHTVTLKELDEFYAFGPPHSGLDKRELFALKDVDKNGVVDWEEMTADPKGKTRAGFAMRSGELASILALDPNKNGKVTVEEADDIVRQFFTEFDRNKNGVIDAKDEFPKVREAVAPKLDRELEFRQQRDRLRAEADARAAAKLQVCMSAPKAAADQKVLYIGAHESSVTSSVHLGDPSVETGVITVQVEEGAEPLYVFAAAAESTVWQFQGAVDRVKTAVIGGGHAGGVLGLPKERVSILPSPMCLPPVHKMESIAGARVRARAAVLAGHEVDLFGGSYTLSGIAIPAMKPVKPVGNGQRLDDAPLVARIDPSMVLSSEPVARYVVLPGKAGLDQLVKEGRLKRLDHFSYKIVKPIPRFPAGLFGGNAVSFLLGTGVPMPEGHPGHSCVVSEETGRTLTGPGGICR